MPAYDFEAIWDRVKESIDTRAFEDATSLSDLKQKIEQAMKDQATKDGKQGNLNNLLGASKEFADIEAEGKEFKAKEIKVAKARPTKKAKKVRVSKTYADYSSYGSISKIAIKKLFSNNVKQQKTRLVIFNKSGRKLSGKETNIELKFGKRKDQDYFYARNVRTKKRISGKVL